MQGEDGLTNWGLSSREGLDTLNYRAQYDQITKIKSKAMRMSDHGYQLELRIPIEIKDKTINSITLKWS